MWKEILFFEFDYRRSRPATYIYFVLMFAMGFLITSTDIIQSLGSGGEVKENSPYMILQITVMAAVFGIFIISAVMGVAIIRDFEHNTEALFFTTSIRKRDYLSGRFLGSWLMLAVILFGFPLGACLGQFMPWKEAGRLGDFNFINYLNPYLLILLPNSFIFGSIFFAVGALSRKMIVVFMQGLIFLLIYMAMGMLFSDIDSKKTGALVDAFGLSAAGLQTNYWSIVEKNTSQLTLTGDFLTNRLLWTGVALALLGITYALFSFKTVFNPIKRQKNVNLVTETKERFKGLPMPFGRSNFEKMHSKVWVMFQIYFKEITKSLPYITLLLSGLIIFIFTEVLKTEDYSTQSLPITYFILNGLIILTGIFTQVMVVIFTADLVWRERAIKMDLIQDALPIPTWSVLVSKCLALLAAMGLMFTIAMVVGILSQVFRGFTDIDLPQYFQELYVGILFDLFIFMLVAFFIQVVANNKFLGMGLAILLLFAGTIIGMLKVRGNLFKFNSGGLGQYSDMNGFGHMYGSFSTIKLYWLGFAILLFTMASLWAVRGTEEKLKTRMLVGKYNLSRKLLTFMVLIGIVVVSSGAVYYNNTQNINTIKSEKEQIAEQVNYEKTLKKFENLAQPRITDVKINVDLFPETRDMNASGTYWLKNKTDVPMPEIHISVGDGDEFRWDKLTLNQPTTLNKKYVEDFGYYIFALKNDLQPNDSIQLSFEMQYETKGFQQDIGNVDIVENGTFLNNGYFPAIGYQTWAELSDPDERKENGLPKRDRVLKRDNPKGLLKNYTGDDADTYTFEATLSTTPKQVAIAPGYLQKEWTKNGRRYFNYKADSPIKNMYSIVSAEYVVKEEKYKGINLEIYYHPKHTYNIDRMMTAMKKSLDYYQAEFGSYQFSQLRIMEFPRYRSFAQSFANTIPFSESMGFVSKVDDKEGVDYPTFVTAHEIAHQWWGHQLIAADVQGASMLSESFAQYSALMLMSKSLADHQIEIFTRNELDAYLRGRSAESEKELPLSLVEQQQYLHYNKGSLILYAIQDIIGEKKLNGVIKSTLQKSVKMVNTERPVYPTTELFTSELKTALPDSLHYLVNDWIDQITFYDLRTLKVTDKKKGQGFEVNLDLSAQKIIVDSVGKETEKSFSEWMWIGVYGEKKDGHDNLIYYQRHKIRNGKQQITVYVKEKPKKAGVDPKTFLIDRKPGDNVENVE